MKKETVNLIMDCIDGMKPTQKQWATIRAELAEAQNTAHNKQSNQCLCDSCNILNDNDCPKTLAFRNNKMRTRS